MTRSKTTRRLWKLKKADMVELLRNGTEFGCNERPEGRVSSLAPDQRDCPSIDQHRSVALVDASITEVLYERRRLLTGTEKLIAGTVR